MRIPVSLSVYEHAAGFVGESPWTVSRDPELLYQAHLEAYRKYRHAPVTIGVDIYNMEAECYGARVAKPEGDGVPSIIEPPFASLGAAMRIDCFDPARDGRIPGVVKAGTRLKRDFPEADVRIPITGPFSLAQGLLGFDHLLMSAVTEPQETAGLLMKLAEGQANFARHVAGAGLGVIVFESAAAPPLLSPLMFEELELPALRRLVQEASQFLGGDVPCFIGGHTAPIVPQMLRTGTNFLICPGETDRVAFLAALAGRPDVKARINMRIERYAGTDEATMRREIDEIVGLAKGRGNILLGTGAIPLDVPSRRILSILEYCGGI